ncbi:diacylglycerol kinase family protein [Oceanicoccus sp. KOV_DT_Chl]|uniref:diacylglycerol kinase family protein n=1 Tax=Oceanicoccus sp. KOV_DT_Chl TaxID=1904639 RepID=UPI000C7E5DF6|nr:diacylglycerol kinase family protein [Oceanicoccus sp. KOV_DT_Chl]
MFELKSRPRSFAYAFSGLSALVRTQANARIHIVATVVVLALAYYLHLQRWEWVAIVFAIAGVWTTEALNTAVEALADACHPEKHPLIKLAKDVAAAAVLIFSLAAMVVAVIVFYPYLFGLQS